VATWDQRWPEVSEFNPARVGLVRALPLPGFEPVTLRSPAICHEHMAYELKLVQKLKENKYVSQIGNT